MSPCSVNNVIMSFLKRRSWVVLIMFFAAGIGAISFLGAVGTAHAAFGSSPPFINPNHLVPGSTYSQTIYLVQDNPSQNLNIGVTLNVPDAIKSWITIDQGLNFVIPEGTHQFPVLVTIAVPQSAGLGKYSGNIVFTTAPSQTGQVTIALGVSVALNLTVGTGIYEQFSVPLITFPDIEEGWNPQVEVKFENDGNIPEAFDSATFQLYDQYDSVLLAYITKQDGFPSTGPFSTNEYTIEFPTDFHLGVGDYWGDVVFYQNSKVIASQKAIFHVLPAGSLLGPWGEAFYFLKNNEWAAYVGGFMLLIIIVLIIWGYRRRSSSRSGREK